jgi:hypothetical protein
MNNPFDYFDKIYCICGEHETTRWERCCEQFEKLGIMDRVERFSDFASQEELKKCKMGGCKHSHYSVIKLARNENLRNVFIFESDFHFINYDFDLMKKSFESLNDVDWKLFYVGGTPHNVYGIINEHLVKSSVSLAHAYAVNGKYLDEVIKKQEKKPHVINDQIYRRVRKFNLGNFAYYSYPMFVTQKDGPIEVKRHNYATKMYNRKIEPKMKKYLTEE